LTPEEARGPAFWTRFDATTLFHDVYRSRDGGSVIAIGPQFREIEADCLRFSCSEDGSPLPWRHVLRVEKPNPRRPVQIQIDLPPDHDWLWVRLGSQRWRVPVQPNLSAAFAGRTALLTISGDNRIEWIEDWARYHAVVCGVDAVALYLNLPAFHDAWEIEHRLAAIPGLREIAVIDQPARFGVRMQDQTGPNRQLDDVLLQESMLQHGIDRILGEASAVLDLDIDELLVLEDGVTIPSVLDGPEPMVRVWRANVHASSGRPEGIVSRHAHATHRFEPFPEVRALPKWIARPAVFPSTFVVGVHGSPTLPVTTLDPGQGFVAHFWELTTSLRDPGRFAAPVAYSEPCRLLQRRLEEAFPAGRRDPEQGSATGF
jgi:hypothetical protein